MANLLLRIFLAVSAVIAVLAIIGSLLPRSYDVTTSRLIPASPDEIFPFIEDLQLWQSWSPWNAHENPNLDVTLGEQTRGTGATQTWTEPRGDGKLWITAAEPPDSLTFSSRFANWPQMNSSLTLTPEGAGTRVTWQSSGSLPAGPFYGWQGLIFFSSGYKSIFDKALQNLEATVKRNQAASGAPQTGPE